MQTMATLPPVRGRIYTIRPYAESDAQAVGQLIADTYGRFNLGWAAPDELAKLLGPFRHAGSADSAHREAIAQVLRAPAVLLAQVVSKVVSGITLAPLLQIPILEQVFSDTTMLP